MESSVQISRPECRVIDLLVCVGRGFVVVNIISPLRPPEQQANRSAQYELQVIRRIVQKYKGTLTLEEQGEFLRKRSSFRCKNKLRKRQPPRSSGNGRTAAVFFCGLLDTSACEKLTNISVYIWQSKTECARKTTDFRTHLAKYGHSDKIMTKNREQEKNHCTTAKTGGIGCVVLQSS